MPALKSDHNKGIQEVAWSHPVSQATQPPPPGQAKPETERDWSKGREGVGLATHHDHKLLSTEGRGLGAQGFSWPLLGKGWV